MIASSTAMEKSPGMAPSRALTTRRMEGTRVSNRNTRKTRKARSTVNGSGRRDQGDGDDSEIEQAPGVAPEVAPMHIKPQGDLHHEHAQDRLIQRPNRPARYRHGGGPGLQSEQDRIDQDQGDDGALHAGIGNEGAQLCAQACWARRYDAICHLGYLTKGVG
jgi:hypothetical protein